MKVRSFATWVSLLACVMDGGTGLFLVFAPAFTLGLMGLDSMGAPLPYLQFIGAFVFAIGTLYGVAWYYLKRGSWVEWRMVWLATAWARLCVGSTVLGLILTGRLEVAWISVPVADLGLGLFQFWYLARTKRVDG